nr:MAG TPA: hypothetical protein [Caudoviricetes sp.]
MYNTRRATALFFYTKKEQPMKLFQKTQPFFASISKIFEFILLYNNIQTNISSIYWKSL